MGFFLGIQERVRNNRGKHAMLYRIGLPSNASTLLALFGGSLRTELHSSSMRSNGAIMLKSSCIWSMTCFPPNRATLDW